MAWPHVDDPDKWATGADTGAAKSKVVSDDDPALRGGALQDVTVCSSEQVLIVRRANVKSSRAKTGDDVRADVLVSEKGEVERFHALVVSSQTCSPLSTSAAKWNAAARPSGVSWEYCASI